MRKPVINPGIINRLKMLFAIVQDGDTATRNIAKGKCVIWKNTPCRAITDISTGDTLSSVNLSTDDEGYINSVENNISNLQDGIAIVANNNTHPSVSSGQFVYVKNHDTLAEGLYKASSNIAVTDPLSTSNLVADNSGGLNALKSDIDTLSSNITALLTPLNTKVSCTAAGFNTGSGNYFDFFYPCNVDVSKNYTATLSGHSIIYASSRKFSGMSATAAVLNKYSNGLFLELSFTETQTANIFGVFYGEITLNVAN